MPAIQTARYARSGKRATNLSLGTDVLDAARQLFRKVFGIVNLKSGFQIQIFFYSHSFSSRLYSKS